LQQATHFQSSLHFKFAFRQEHLWVEQPLLHPQLMNSSTLSGAGFSDIQLIANRLFMSSHPLSSGLVGPTVA
jgi:hypothetical protein